MYIEIHDWKEFEQKVLYYKLNNSFNMNLISELNYKIAGVYAIYKDDICLYVGQSRNLASRIATHLRGKYENCTNIYVWDIQEIGFKQFRGLIKDIQEQVLIRTEKFFMSKLKPIENLDIDMDYKDGWKPLVCFESSSNYTIQLVDRDLRITDNYPHNLENLTMSIKYYKEDDNFNQSCIEEIYTHLKNQSFNYFYDKGVSNEN